MVEPPASTLRQSRRSSVSLLFVALIVVNALAWIAAFLAFRDAPGLMGAALLAWGLGLRHSVDADHIAAIDNVTRKLMQDGARPIAVGLWFAIGHSAVILLGSGALAFAAVTFSHVEAFREIGGLIATLTSAFFLFAIAALNLLILASIWRAVRTAKQVGLESLPDLDQFLAARGLLSKLFRPVFRLVTRPWHMALLGALFGLGFDTVTEIAILGLSASKAASGMMIGEVLILPALFAAGMMLIDTADGVLMLRAYEWALVRPLRKLYYNMFITATSAAVAIIIGGVEMTNLLAERFGWRGWLIAGTAKLAQNFTLLGVTIIALFLFLWGVSVSLAVDDDRCPSRPTARRQLWRRSLN